MAAFLVYGTFMRDQPGHANLAGATLLEAVRTAPRYRLFEVDGLWPALVADENGVAITAELYEISAEHVERLAALEPPGWRRGPVAIEDGRSAEAFLGDAALRARGVDVSAYGGWAEYLALVDAATGD